MKVISKEAASRAHDFALQGLDHKNIHDRIASAIAPVLCHFIKELQLAVATDKISDVWFMARDGYLLKRLYDLARTEELPASGYLYVSRRSTSAASSTSYGIREAFLAEWNGENRKLRTMLTTAKIANDDLAALAARYGFSSPDEQLETYADPRFVALLNDPGIRCLLSTEMNTARKKLLRYLEQSGFLESARPAVVDVGWAGQIQEAIQLTLESKAEHPPVLGYYLALRKLGGLRRLAGVACKGLIFDCAKPSHWSESILNAVDIFEDTCRACHGSVVDYDNDGNAILASHNHESFVAEQKDNPKLAALQDAIIRYADRWFTFREVTIEESRIFALDALASLTRMPTKEQALYYLTLGHGLDFGNDTVLSHNVQRSWNPLKIWAVIRSARWKEGTAATLPFPKVLQLILALLKARWALPAIPTPTLGNWEFVKHVKSKRTVTENGPIFTCQVDLPQLTSGRLYAGLPSKGLSGRILCRLLKR